MKNKIKFLDLSPEIDRIKPEIYKVIENVIFKNTNFILGKEVEIFENNFANYISTKYCIGVGNGLDALHLVLKAWDIGTGDEVIVPSNTYVATWLAISHTGAVPFPVEPVESRSRRWPVAGRLP